MKFPTNIQQSILQLKIHKVNTRNKWQQRHFIHSDAFKARVFCNIPKT